MISTAKLDNQKLINPSDFVFKQSGSVYHYYYKGIICPHHSIDVFVGFASNVVVDYLEHNSSANENYYIDDNYSKWSLSESNSSDLEWLNFMKNLYQSPTIDERKQAIVIS